MAEQEELKIAISADVTDFVRNLGVATNLLEEFGQKGRQAIADLNKDFRGLGRSFNAGTKPIDTTQLTDKIRQLKTEIDSLKQQIASLSGSSSGVSNSLQNTRQTLDGVSDASRRGRIAVYALNQVVRDLPFGFIAISNNLPVLIDQFQQLRAESKSTGAALRNFVSSLFTIAGINILISAAISLVTTAVQKYGSLGRAYDALVGSVDAYKKVQQDATREAISNFDALAQQISRLELLNSLSNNARIGLENQRQATALLRQEVDKIVVSQDLLKSTTQEVTREQINYAKRVVIARTILQGFQTVIGQTAVEFAKAKIEGVTFVDTIVASVQKVFAFTNAIKRGNFEFAKQIFNTSVGEIALARYNKRLSELENQLVESIKQQRQFAEEQIANGIKVVDLFDQGIKLDKQGVREKEKAEKQKLALVKASLNELLAADKQALAERIEILRTEIDAQKALVSGLEKTDKDYLTEYSRLLGLQEELDRVSAATKIRDRTNLYAALRNIDQEYFNKYIAAQKDVDAKIAAERQKALRVDEKDRIQAINNIIKGAESGIDRVIADQQRLSQEYIDGLREIVEPAVNIFNRTLAPAIDNVFNAILNGQDAVRALGQSFKQLVIDLTATVIKAAALAALVSIISGGKIPFGATFRAGLSSRGIGDFLGNLLPSGGFGLNAAPINGPGGFGLSGQVVFVQRGADLVGVLDRTNARIGRIG